MSDSDPIKPQTFLDVKPETGGNLRQTQKMEALGTLVGGIAHDFNNILAILEGNLDILQEEDADAATRAESLELAQKALHRATGVVRQLLTFARKSEVNFETLDLDYVVREMLQMVVEAFPKTLEISFSSDEMEHPISGDHNQLDQALLNLFINARDAMPAGGRLILDLRAARPDFHKPFPEGGDPEYVCLTIRDTGIGMDEETRSRIFEPYFSTKNRQVSSGLGLAMVYGIVKLHKGFIEVDSEPGKGTAFRLYFPKQRKESELEADPKAPDEVTTLAGNESVLFAEDEGLLLRVIRRALEKRGYRVLEARDGLQAIETYREHRDEIAVVVLDMGLPKLDGWEVFHRLKEIDPGLKAIAMSGYVDPDLKDRMLEEGMQEVISKPFPAIAMLRAIRSVIDRPAI